MGGWYKFLEAQKEEEKRGSEREELEYQQLQVQIQTLKKDLGRKQWRWSIGTFIVTLIASIIANNLEFILKFFGLIEAK